MKTDIPKNETPGAGGTARGGNGGASDKAHPSKQTAQAQGLPACLGPLIALPHWVVWRWGKRDKNGKLTKVPYQTNGAMAKSNDPKTWTTYDAVIAAVEKFDGIGFCLLGSGFAAFDIDDCRDPTTGRLDPWAEKLVARVGSYTEVTVSGTGLRIIGTGNGPKLHRKLAVINGVSLEAYRQAERYIVMTGDVLPGAEPMLVNIDEHMDAVVAELDGGGKQQNKKSSTTTGELPQELRNMLHLQGDKPVGDYPSRSELFWAFINTALRKGIDENLIVEACCDDKYAGCAIHEHVKDNRGADYVRRQIERAANATATDDKGRVCITVEEGKLDEAWRATQDALMARGCPVYVRGGQLVQPLWRWEQADDGRNQVLTVHLELINVPRLMDITAHHAVQFQKKHDKRRLKNIDPPKAVISQLIEIKHWLFPTVRGIINAPTMRPDGSLLTEPGYDPKTQLWYKSSGDVVLPPIPEHPTKAQAKEALALLNGLFRDFPFEVEETETADRCVARSVALAGMMTAVLRGALPVAVPIFLVTATEARTGKTYLVGLIAMLATGHIPPSTAGASEDRPDEIEKRIETAALSGRPILHLNNLPNGMILQSERLSELCTEGIINVRKLGRLEEATCDCRATTVFLNGNNVQVAGDLVLRTAVCRLNAKTAEPEGRDFGFSPIEEVRKARGTYLAAVFTIARAFITAGCPRPAHMHSVAGFEAWSRLVQQPLLWLGMADPWGGMQTMRAMDPTLEELTNLLQVLRDTFKADERFTVADCNRKAEEQGSDAYGRPYYLRPKLRDLMTFHGRINLKSFGRLLLRHRDRISDGWCYGRYGVLAGSVAYKLVAPTGASVAAQEVEQPL